MNCVINKDGIELVTERAGDSSPAQRLLPVKQQMLKHQEAQVG